MLNRFLDKLAKFAALPPDAVDAILSATAGPRKFAARRDLIREGDQPGPVFVILEGWACRYKILPNGTRQVMALLMPGDCCDIHIGLLHEMDHSIQTITPAQVATIGRTDMDAIFAHHPSVATAMYISQLIDEGTMRAWITSMGRRSSIERVAHLICELYVRAHNVGVATEHEFALPLSQLLLADCLGMTPVHLNRVLKRLRLDGAMALGRGNLVITDPVKLTEIAGFDENYLHRRMRKVA